MQPNHPRVIVAVLVGLMLYGCNLPSNRRDVSPITSPTMYVMTLSALQTRAVMTATSQGVAAGPTPAPIPPSGGTPGSPATVIINDTLCWRGPGPRYETISAIFKGTQVKLLGRSLLPGWYILVDPIYLEPCWVQAGDVQVGGGVDVNALPVYAIPSSPTPTPFPTRTPGAVTPTAPPRTATGVPLTPVPTGTLPSITNTPVPATPTPSSAPTLPAPSPAPTGTP